MRKLGYVLCYVQFLFCSSVYHSIPDFQEFVAKLTAKLPYTAQLYRWFWIDEILVLQYHTLLLWRVWELFYILVLLAMEFEFKVFTLNCWGIPVVSRDRPKRMQAIADYLSEGLCYDIVCLQEVWSESDFCLIKTKTAKVYPYSHYFYRFVWIHFAFCY